MPPDPTNPVPNPAEIGRVFEAAEQAAEALQRQLASGATQLGYILRVVHETKPILISLASGNNAAGYSGFLVSGLSQMHEVTRQLEQVQPIYSRVSPVLSNIYLSAGSFASGTAATACLAVPYGSYTNPNITLLPVSPTDPLIGKLERKDPSLAATLREMTECLYGTTSDPVRSAEFMLRQVYDHFFCILAPDDRVRNSRFWARKAGPNPEAIHRPERINYALETHIADHGQRALLSESSKQMLEVYYQLSGAHERGALDAEKARAALRAMHDYLNNWVAALGW